MAAELLTVTASIIGAGPTAKELIVAFRLSDRMSDVAIDIDESESEVIVSVKAVLDAPSEASSGWFPYLTHTSARVVLDRVLGARPVRATRALTHC